MPKTKPPREERASDWDSTRTTLVHAVQIMPRFVIIAVLITSYLFFYGMVNMAFLTLGLEWFDPSIPFGPAAGVIMTGLLLIWMRRLRRLPPVL